MMKTQIYLQMITKYKLNILFECPTYKQHHMVYYDSKWILKLAFREK